MNNSKQIKLGALISYISIIINIILTLLYTPWMVHKIGPANYGLYTLSISIIGMFMMDFGLSASIARFIAKFRAEKKHKKIGEYLGSIYKLYILIDIIIIIVLGVIFLNIDSIYKELTLNEISIFKTLFIIVATYNIIQFPFITLNGILEAYEKFIPLKLSDLFNKILTVLFVVLVLFFKADVVLVVAANTVSGIITILLKLLIINRTIKLKLNFKVNDKKIYTEVFSFSMWTTVMSIVQRLTYNFAPSILGIVAGSIQIAIYSPISSIGSYFYAIAAAMNGLFLSTVSRIIAKDKNDNITDLMIKVGKYQFFVLGLIFAGFVSVGKDFMILWMGKNFENAYYGICLIMIPSLIEYSQQIANTAMVVQNKIKFAAIGFSSIMLLGLPLSIFLSKLFGAIGVSLSICIIGLLNNIYLNIIYYKVLKINVFKFFQDCYLKGIIPIIITVIVGIGVNLFIIHPTYIGLAVKSIIVFVVYSLTQLFFVLTKQEIYDLKNKIVNLFKKENKNGSI